MRTDRLVLRQWRGSDPEPWAAMNADDDMPFTGVEIGWRLARPAWGHGYATEAARAVLAYGFDDSTASDGPLRPNVLHRIARGARP